jgi:hypothetical protein
MSATTAINTTQKKQFRLFSQRLIALLSDGTAYPVRSGGLLSLDLVVVSRALCRFRRITLPSETRNAVKAALLQAKRDASSEANITQLVQDQNNRKQASIWAWPEQAETQHSGADSASRSIPETLAREPMQSGRRLVQCLEGVEGQVWEDGALMASRWWPDVPGQSQWVTFLRSARLKTDEISLDLPPVVEVPWRTNLPFFQGAVETLQAFVTPRRLLAVLALFFATLLVYNGAQYVRFSQTTKTLQAQISERKEVVSDILAERNQAMLNLQAIEKIQAMGKPTTLLFGIVGVLENIQGQDLKVTKITLRDRQLEILITGVPEQNGATLVKAMEASPSLERVSVNFLPGKLVKITANLTGKAAP